MEVHEMLTSTVRKPIVFVAMLMIAAGVLAACTTGDDSQPEVAGSGATSVAASSVTAAPSGPAEPERHTFTTGDPSFDGAYVVTMKLADGYEPTADGHVVFGSDSGQGLSTWTVGNVYAKPCHSNHTLLDPPIDPSVDALVAGLASQKGHPATKPTDVEVDGYAGTYMEMTVPAGIDVADCDHGEYRTWVDPLEGERNLEAGQRDLLWIIDVDGRRLVIDAALGPQTTEQDRADRVQMVESMQIEPI
jgi:hypothetical protein